MKQRKNIWFVMILAIAAISVIYGFTADNLKTGDNVPLNDNQGQVTGEQLYQKNCAACHGLDRQGNPPAFPSLVSVGERLNKEQVGKLLQTGRNLMPSFAHLSDQEREALTGYLFGETTSVETPTEITPEQNGQRLFTANCARCHKATPDDPQPPDQREWGMQPAVLGGITASYSKESFKNVLNSGPCYMPSFDFLADSDKEDIYLFLSSIKGTYNKQENRRMTGCRMGCKNR